MNFTPPTKLTNFASSFGVTTCSKDVWPYGLYKTVDEIRQAESFPPITDFCKVDLEDPMDEYAEATIFMVGYDISETFGDELDFFGIPRDDFTASELERFFCPSGKAHLVESHLKISPLKYMHSKMDFDEKVKSGIWTSMLDQLRHYNLLDCQILMHSWHKYTDLFYTEFGVDPQQYMSLSQLAQTVLFQHYPKNHLPIVSFSESYTWLNKELRGNLFGGLSAVFSRHAQIENDSKFPKCAMTVPNGSPITKIQQLDVNSLYSTVMKQDLPVGSGVLYTNVDGVFVPEVMVNNSGRNASKISFHWLNHMQKRYMSPDGPVYIQCEFTGGEKQIGNFFLDGYVEYNGKRIGLDFRMV